MLSGVLLVCIVRGTGSGMLSLVLLVKNSSLPPGSPTTDVFTPKTANFNQQNTPAIITASPLLAYNLLQKYVSCLTVYHTVRHPRNFTFLILILILFYPPFYRLQNCYIVTYSIVYKAYGIPLAAVLI
jgi:hypothetical protein